ncbi:MAG: ScpA family protein [Candidatus Paceibacterota bacterium]
MSLTKPKQTFAIKTEVFEGPLELLLDLVERRKLLINDISLAAVTDEYLEHVSRMQEQSLAGTAHFVQLAATLLLIKSKSLLPVLELTDEEESSIEELEERLKLYQIYRTAAQALGEVFGTHIMHERQYASRTKSVFVPDAYTTVEELNAAMYRVIAELPKVEEKPRVQVKTVISLEEMIDRLHQRIEATFKLRFSELLGPEKERTTVIVGFLAILESVKQGKVLVAQTARFADIEIEKEGITAPRYH